MINTILQNELGARRFDRSSSAPENCIAIFRRRWCQHRRDPMSASGAETKDRENKMKQFWKLTAAPATTLAFVAMATPAAASLNEYCRTDSSGMRSCGFSSMEQCQAMSSGRGGSCARDPFLPTASDALAYQPKHSHSKSPRKPALNQ
jgi:Protein of unknown function (DUF3551)